MPRSNDGIGRWGVVPPDLRAEPWPLRHTICLSLSDFCWYLFSLAHLVFSSVIYFLLSLCFCLSLSDPFVLGLL